MSDARVKSNHGPGRHILVAGYQGISTVVIYCDDINTPYSHPYTSQGRDSRTHNHLPDCTNLSKPHNFPTLPLYIGSFRRTPKIRSLLFNVRRQP
jgi:hypothetical protein